VGRILLGARASLPASEVSTASGSDRVDAGSVGIPAPQVKSVPRAVATGLMLGAWASLPASEVSTASGSDRVDAGSADVPSALSAQRDRGSSPTVREGVIVRVLSVPPAVAGGPLSALADE